ncbi:MAG TPA: hypothetical protein VEZ11_06915 [Thermoanaerobaculia bacterium]|nr:hypothetical protein [Thermoanaerobaculia bacterium]
MAQFLLLTTLLSIAGLVATMVAGYLASPGHVAQHILFALATVVVGLFSQSMTMFFFIGTGKELKEKVKGGGDEDIVLRQTKAFKARVFPAAMYAIAVLMITFIMGGGVATGKTPRWLHQALAIASVVMLGRAYWVQIRAMDENARLMEKHLAE